MIKSNLATQVVDFGTKNSNPRSEKISKVTIHHMAGNMGAAECARFHRDGNREASANYYIGSDGTICAGVSEDRRAWTSASPWNDHRAITIEVANNSFDPNWTVSDKAYLALINLCIDICKRYNIVPAYDGTKNATFTEHRMFAATLCPGPYLHNKMRDIVDRVKRGLNSGSSDKPAQSKILYKVQVGAFTKKANADAFQKDVKSKGFDSFVTKVGRYYKVQIGAFSKKANADAMQKKAIAAGYKDAFIVEVKED